MDAMGGDHAPEAIVEGATMAVSEYDCDIVLVGAKEQVEPLAAKSPHWGRRLHLHHASETISMSASPTDAVRKYKDASIVVATRMVKEGMADAVVSAGHTGVAMVTALRTLGRAPGVERPAIGAILPTLKGACIMVDVGAIVDARPSHLHQFGRMGSIYAERVLKIAKPRVALLSIGEEEGKGSETVQLAYERMKADPELHFVGNVEGRGVLSGEADVFVCDGFVGNVVLKFAEGMASVVFQLLKESIYRDMRSRLGGVLLRPALKELWTRMDYTEYGGAPLLGIAGVSIISHGASDAKAIKNAIRVAKESVEQRVTDAIGQASQEWAGERS